MNISKQNKSKPITTSVPSFAIRFHAGGEELEELYPSEEEEKSEKSSTEEKPAENASTGEPNKHESSPMRDYLNKFGKRSSSIDTGINETTSLGPQTAASDPWRIFSEFKGKLTKTVEEKLSEIKSKGNDGENSPKLTNKSDKNKNTSGSKENSSVSDSEEQSFSECSIPKSGGLSSTAEDLEMSSDDENSLAESDKTPTESPNKDFNSESSKKSNLRHRVKSNKPYVQFSPAKNVESDSHVKISSLSTVHEKEGHATEDEVESGVEACEEFTNPGTPAANLELDENAVTLVAPPGFVDTRRSLDDPSPSSIFKSRLFWPVIVALISICFMLPLPNFLLGFIIGVLAATVMCAVYYYLRLRDVDQMHDFYYARKESSQFEMPILEVPAVKEYQPVTKFEGWMNEYPEPYDPRTYHILKTQSVFMKLEGSILRLSHTRAKIPKRAMWNEPKHKVVFTHHRIYNLKGSQVMLLPTGLIHKRIWSKKYPICIILNKEKMNLDLQTEKKEDEDRKDDLEVEDELESPKKSSIANESYAGPLVEIDDSAPVDIDPTSLHGTEDEKDVFSDSFSDAILEDDKDEEISITAEDWDTLTLEESSLVETKIYIFARTCRDKEDWYRRLVYATHDDSVEVEKTEEEAQTTEGEGGTPAELPEQPQGMESVRPEVDEEEYLRYMSRFNQVKTQSGTRIPRARRKSKRFRKKKGTPQSDEEESSDLDIRENNNLWFNAFIARVLYDVCKHDTVINKFQFLIQKKISTIKLPYFIETIVMTDLSLGKSCPTVYNISAPSMDERGLWVHMDLRYEGVISMAIVTKLNLMKLKEQAGRQEEPVAGVSSVVMDTRSPIFHSDVEDSAESSSDEETAAAWVLDQNHETTSAKPNTGGKKFLRMVDKIASSKYFQQATENKYIKRAMEGVSKTEIKLIVDIQFLEGTLALNIPPPPSDRIWLGFKGNPKLQLSAHPTFGERSINFLHVTRWIEKKLTVEFQKFLVLPNMEDFVLPMLIPKLPQ